MTIFKKIFNKASSLKIIQKFKEIGKYNSIFTAFSGKIFDSDVVKSCIRPLAEHSSKANPRCTNKRIEKLLQYNPNAFMNGKDFLAKVRICLEVNNTAFIYIQRDDLARVIGFYPIPYQSYEALEHLGEIYIKFTFIMGQSYILSWKDLAVLRKDYYESDISGDDNQSIVNTLELINTTNQGVANAVKATANLRGILKSTKAMLATEDTKRQKENFVKDYLSLENEGGIAALDSTQDFIPIKMEPQTTSYLQMKEFRENVYRYFGVNENIITSNYTESQLESFYESRIEPFLVALGLELTNKVFTERERGFNNEIIFESNRMQYASNNTKLAMVSMVDRGALTPNEWRMMFNLSPIEGGDKPIRRLDTAQVEDVTDKGETDE